MGSRVGGASWRLKICLVGKLLKHVSFACVVPRFDVSDTVISDLNRVPWPRDHSLLLALMLTL